MVTVGEIRASGAKNLTEYKKMQSKPKTSFVYTKVTNNSNQTYAPFANTPEGQKAREEYNKQNSSTPTYTKVSPSSSGGSNKTYAPFANTPEGQKAREEYNKQNQIKQPSFKKVEFTNKKPLTPQEIRGQRPNTIQDTAKAFTQEGKKAIKEENFFEIKGLENIPIASQFQTGLNFVTKQATVGGRAIASAGDTFFGSIFESRYLSNKAISRGLADYSGMTDEQILEGFGSEQVKKGRGRAYGTGVIAGNIGTYFIAPEVGVAKTVIDVAATPKGSNISESFQTGVAIGGSLALAEKGARFIPGVGGKIISAGIKYGVPLYFTASLGSQVVANAPDFFQEDKSKVGAKSRKLFSEFGGGMLGGRIGSGGVNAITQRSGAILRGKYYKPEQITSKDVLQKAAKGEQYYKPITKKGPVTAKDIARINKQFSKNRVGKELSIKDRVFLHATDQIVGKEFRFSKKYIRPDEPLGFGSYETSLEFTRLRSSSRPQTSFVRTPSGSPKVVVLPTSKGVGRLPGVKFGSGAKGVQKGNVFFRTKAKLGEVFNTPKTVAIGKNELEFGMPIGSGGKRIPSKDLYGKLTGNIGYTKIKSKGPLGLPFTREVGITLVDNSFTGVANIGLPETKPTTKKTNSRDNFVENTYNKLSNKNKLAFNKSNQAIKDQYVKNTGLIESSIGKVSKFTSKLNSSRSVQGNSYNIFSGSVGPDLTIFNSLINGSKSNKGSYQRPPPPPSPISSIFDNSRTPPPPPSVIDRGGSSPPPPPPSVIDRGGSSPPPPPPIIDIPREVRTNRESFDIFSPGKIKMGAIAGFNDIQNNAKKEKRFFFNELERAFKKTGFGKI